MDSVTLYVGLDYHQDNVQVCVLDAAGGVRVNKSVPSDASAVARAIADVQVKAVAIEACCGAAVFGEQLAALGDWRVELAHPGYVSRLKQSPDKTDFSDARLLADLTRVGYLPRVWLAPPPVRDRRQLVHHRVRLVDRRRALKLQIGAVLREQRVKVDMHSSQQPEAQAMSPSQSRGNPGAKAKASSPSRWSKRWLACLRDNPRLREHVRWVMNDLLDELAHVSEKIRGVEGRLRRATAEDAVVEKLRTIEGVGEVTAWMLRAWVGRFDRFKTGKQLSRYCGLSPRNASSGQRQADAGLINAANKPLRAVLVQAAHRLMRTSERWIKLADSMLRRGKPKPLVVAAVANRWVRSMHHRMIPTPAMTPTIS